METFKILILNYEKKILERPKFLLTAIILLNVIGGILFGYSLTIGTVSLYPLAQDFTELETKNTTNALAARFIKGSVQSSFLLGNVFGPLFAPTLYYYTGKSSLLILSLFTSFAIIGLFLSVNVPMLIIFRAITGLGMGLATQISTRFVFELSPVDKRGVTGAFFFFGTTFGGLLGGISFVFTYVKYNWRIMFGISIIFSFGLFIFTLITPEVPDWRELKNEGVNYSEIISEFKNLKIMVYINCIILMFMLQMGGANAVLSFLPQIIQRLGYTDIRDISIGSCIVLFMALLFSFLSTFIVQRFNRRTMVLIGGVIMFIGNLGIALSSLLLPEFIKPYVGIAFINLWLFGNNNGVNAVIFFIFNELFPSTISRIGSAIMISLNNGVRLIVVLFILPIQGLIGQSNMFFIFAGCNLLFGALIFFLLPETKPQNKDESVKVVELEEKNESYKELQVDVKLKEENQNENEIIDENFKNQILDVSQEVDNVEATHQ